MPPSRRRTPPSPTEISRLSSTFALLASEMKLACEMLDHPESRATHGLLAVALSVNAVRNFLQGNDETRPHLAAFRILDALILDIARGNVHPLIAARPRSGRRGLLPMQSVELRHDAVLSVEVLLARGLSLTDAAEFVASAYTKAGHKLSGGAHTTEITSRAVLNWRSRAGQKDHEAIASWVQRSLKAIADRPGAPPSINAVKAAISKAANSLAKRHYVGVEYGWLELALLGGAKVPPA